MNLINLIGLSILLACIGSATYLFFFYSPTMEVDSWGKPDEADVCGYCFLACLALVLITITAIGGLMLLTWGVS